MHKISPTPFGYRARTHDREQFHKLLDHLFDLMDQSAPTLRSDTTKGICFAEPSKSHDDKDFLSRDALSTAGQLIEPLIQWAVNHQAGLIINGVENAPSRGGEPANRITKYDYGAAREAANEIRHEEAGAGYDYSNPDFNRRILAEVLSGLHMAFPQELISQIVGALEALDAGEVHSILEPQVGRNQPASTLDELKLNVLEFIAYRQGKGMTARAAKDKVLGYPGGFGDKKGSVSEDTVKSWRKYLQKNHEKGAISDEIDRAYTAGRGFIEKRHSVKKSVEDNVIDLPLHKHSNDEDDSLLRSWEGQYGDAALAEAGERFRKIWRGKGNNEGWFTP